MAQIRLRYVCPRPSALPVLVSVSGPRFARVKTETPSSGRAGPQAMMTQVLRRPRSQSEPPRPHLRSGPGAAGEAPAPASRAVGTRARGV